MAPHNESPGDNSMSIDRAVEAARKVHDFNFAFTGAVELSGQMEAPNGDTGFIPEISETHMDNLRAQSSVGMMALYQTVKSDFDSIGLELVPADLGHEHGSAVDKELAPVISDIDSFCAFLDTPAMERLVSQPKPEQLDLKSDRSQVEYILSEVNQRLYQQIKQVFSQDSPYSEDQKQALMGTTLGYYARIAPLYKKLGYRDIQTDRLDIYITHWGQDTLEEYLEADRRYLTAQDRRESLHRPIIKDLNGALEGVGIFYEQWLEDIEYVENLQSNPRTEAFGNELMNVLWRKFLTDLSFTGDTGRSGQAPSPLPQANRDKAKELLMEIYYEHFADRDLEA